jgi:CBS domain containing-hemolysin-like protein
MTNLILYISLTFVLSAMCSMLEAIILSLTATDIGLLKRQGVRTAPILEQLKSNINRPLSAILTINTAANMLGASVVGVEVTHIFGEQYLGLASGLLTLFILLFSEVLPKTFGARYALKMAPYVAYLMFIMVYLVYPFVLLSEKVAQAVPVKDESNHLVAREELIVSAEIGENKGSIHEKESRVIKNLLSLDKITVLEIMTPRANVLGYHKETPVREIISMEKTIRYSRLPVFGEDLDDIIGVVHRYKLVEAQKAGNVDVPIAALASPILYISQHISVANALDQFIQQKQHIFVVVDTYGATSGILTMEDAIETLLGVDITDEFDKVDETPHRIVHISHDPNKFIIKKRV